MIEGSTGLSHNSWTYSQTKTWKTEDVPRTYGDTGIFSDSYMNGIPFNDTVELCQAGNAF